MVEAAEVKIMIGVPTADIIRHAIFMDFFHGIEKEAGTIIAFIHGSSPARGRNTIIQAALDQNYDYVLFLDDDMHPPSDCIKRLVSHDKDIVGGLYLMRNYPHFPLMFEKAYSDGRCLHKFLSPTVKGLVRVGNTGFGCVLIKTKVFKAMEKPWVTLGEYEKDHWCDDLSFFNRAQDKGFEIYVDTDVICGHMATTILYPQYVNGEWTTGMATGRREMVHVPQVVPDVSMYDRDGKLINA